MENLIIICPRVRPELYEVPGAVHKSCWDCGCLVSLGPDSQRLLKKYPDSLVVCTGCAVKVVRKDSPAAAPVGRAAEMWAYRKRN